MTQFCTNCGAALSPNDAFCSHCGAGADTATQNQGEPRATQPPPIQKVTSRFCTTCGSGLVTDESFCSQCGRPAEVPLGNKQVPKTAPPVTNPLPPAQTPQRTAPLSPSYNQIPKPKPNASGTVLKYIGVFVICVILAFIRQAHQDSANVSPSAGTLQGSQPLVSPYSAATPDLGLSGVYATQDMINMGMVNTMNITFYSNGTFQQHSGGMNKDESGTYKINGNRLIFYPGDPVYNHSDNPAYNGIVQSMMGTVSDDKSTVNYAGGIWIKVY